MKIVVMSASSETSSWDFPGTADELVEAVFQGRHPYGSEEPAGRWAALTGPREEVNLSAYAGRVFVMGGRVLMFSVPGRLYSRVGEHLVLSVVDPAPGATGLSVYVDREDGAGIWEWVYPGTAAELAADFQAGRYPAEGHLCQAEEAGGGSFTAPEFRGMVFEREDIPRPHMARLDLRAGGDGLKVGVSGQERRDP